MAKARHGHPADETCDDCTIDDLEKEVKRLRDTLRAVVAATSGSHATGARFAHDLAARALKDGEP